MGEDAVEECCLCSDKFSNWGRFCEQICVATSKNTDFTIYACHSCNDKVCICFDSPVPDEKSSKLHTWCRMKYNSWPIKQVEFVNEFINFVEAYPRLSHWGEGVLYRIQYTYTSEEAVGYYDVRYWR